MEILVNGKEIKLSLLYSEKEIQEQIKKLASEIAEHYKKFLQPKERILLVPILEGAIFFATDLLRQLRKYFPPGTFEFDSLGVSSYLNSKTQGEVRITKDLKRSPRGKHVLVIEDIIDTGNTLENIKMYLESKEVKSLTLVVLVDKSPMRQKDIKIDFIGFKVEKPFWLLGYGLDLAGWGRDLPDIWYLKE